MRAASRSTSARAPSTAVQKRFDLVTHRQQTRLFLQILGGVQAESLECLPMPGEGRAPRRPISCPSGIAEQTGKRLFPVEIEIAKMPCRRWPRAASPSMSSSPALSVSVSAPRPRRPKVASLPRRVTAGGWSIPWRAETGLGGMRVNPAPEGRGKFDATTRLADRRVDAGFRGRGAAGGCRRLR